MKKFLLSGIAIAGLVGFAHPAFAAETLELKVLGTTDIHGHIFPTNYDNKGKEEALGLAKIHTLVKEIRSRHPHTLLVDAGDLLQGTPLTYLYAKQETKKINPMIAVMNQMGYDAFAIGNHDFNYGIPYLLQTEKNAEFPFLGANIIQDKPSADPAFKPYIIRDIGGAKVGIIGFCTPGVMVWDRANVTGKLKFLDMVATAKKYVPEIKQKGADVVVAVAHSGLGAPHDETFSGYSGDLGLPPENAVAAMAEQVPGIDVILAGHSHKELSKLEINGVIISQAKRWGDRLAEVTLKLEKQTKGWKVISKDAQTLKLDKVAPAPEILAIAQEAHDKTLAYINQPIGKTTAPMPGDRSRVEDTALVDLINEIQRDAVGSDLASAASFNTNVNLDGSISILDITALYPFENTLVGVQITGKQLKAYLEQTAQYYNAYQSAAGLFNTAIPGYNYDMISGVDYKIDISKPIGSRVSALMFKGKPVSDTQTFTLALNNYRQGGGGNYALFKDAPVIYNKGEEIRQLIIDYIREKKVIDPAKFHQRNWELLPNI